MLTKLFQILYSEILNCGFLKIEHTIVWVHAYACHINHEIADCKTYRKACNITIMHWVPVIDWSPGTEAIRSHVPVSAMVYHILCCNQRITQFNSCPFSACSCLSLNWLSLWDAFRVRSLSWLFLTKNNIVAHIMSRTWMWRSQMVMVVTVTSPYKRKLHPFALLSNMLTFSEN